MEPVDGTAVYERREHPQSSSENLSQRTHGNNEMDIGLDAEEISIEHVHFGGRQALSETVILSGRVNSIQVLILVEIGDIT